MRAIKLLTDWNSGDDNVEPGYTPDSLEFQRDLNDVLRSHDALLAALRLILPMAKGYAAAHPVGSNAEYVRQAQAAIAKAEALS